MGARPMPEVGRAVVAVRGGLGLLMAISLTDWVPDKTRDMEVCRIEAERFYHMYNAVDPNDPSSQYVIGCMATKGYEFAPFAKACDTRYPLPTQVTCYTPSGWLDWLVDHFGSPAKSK
jgi:hypothetical protein